MSGKEAKKLLCPECGGALKEVYSEASYGRILLLDQCASCGGVWFDRWELYFTSIAALKSLGSVDVKAFLAGSPEAKGTEECPRCSIELKAFTDPNLPKDALIERCPNCSGLWLNRGELGRYAEHKRSFNHREGGVAELETLKHLQKELKVGEIATPTTLELASKLDSEPPLDTREVAKDLGFLALQALVRLVFKV